MATHGYHLHNNRSLAELDRRFTLLWRPSVYDPTRNFRYVGFRLHARFLVLNIYRLAGSGRVGWKGSLLAPVV
jgi:hypothetical protein